MDLLLLPDGGSTTKEVQSIAMFQTQWYYAILGRGKAGGGGVIQPLQEFSVTKKGSKWISIERNVGCPKLKVIVGI